MARLVLDAKIQKREQRLRLSPAPRPYWLALNDGEHLGYYKGKTGGKWYARYRAVGQKGGYIEQKLAEADDFADANGETILDFRQAQEAVRKWVADILRNEGRRTGLYTVSHALDDYLAGFQGKDLVNTKQRIEKLIRPALGDIVVAKLTAKAIIDWRDGMAAGAARIRTRGGEDQLYKALPISDDDRRKRKASANRTLTVFKAAMNVAYRNGKVANDDAWRRVKAFAKVDAPKMRYLSDDEARRLVNASEPDFRLLAQAALLTGARYGELCKMKVRDFDPTAGTIFLPETKNGKSRFVYLDDDGMALIERLAMGRAPDDFMLVKADGEEWRPSQQARRILAACQAAKVTPCGVHDLRRTYGARLALKGVPMAVIAEAMGHSDERITRRHYAHLAPSFVADTVRAAMRGYGLVERDDKVVAFR